MLSNFFENIIISSIFNFSFSVTTNGLYSFIKFSKSSFDIKDSLILSDNNEIEELLDTADYIKEQYFLEVSSTGVEKIIRKEKHLQENVGEYITVNLFKSVNNSKEFIGMLKKFDDETIYIEVNGEVIELERKNISLIKKYYDWENE